MVDRGAADQAAQIGKTVREHANMQFEHHARERAI